MCGEDVKSVTEALDVTKPDVVVAPTTADPELVPP